MCQFRNAIRFGFSPHVLKDLMAMLTMFEVDHLPKKNIDSKANRDQKYKKHKAAH